MEKTLSARSRRRLRLRLAKCLAEQDECNRKRHACEASQMTKSDDRGGNESVSCVGRSDGNLESCPEQAGVSGENPGTIDDDSPQDVESDGDLESDGECADSLDDEQPSSESCSDKSDDDYDLTDSHTMNSELSHEESLSFSESASSSTHINKTSLPEVDDGIPLFPGSRIPSAHFDVVLMSLVQRHNLTYACETDLLQLFSMVLPSPNRVPSSASTFTSKFANFRSDVLIQHFCGCCLTLLDSELSCTRPQCTASKEQHSVFIRIPLASQLIDRFQGIFSVF